MKRGLFLVALILFGCLPSPDGRFEIPETRDEGTAINVVTGAEIKSQEPVETESEYYPPACPTAEPSSGFTVYRFPRRISIPTPED